MPGQRSGGSPHAAGADPVVLVNPPRRCRRWSLLLEFAGLQMVAPAADDTQGVAITGWRVERLGPADAADMLELASATKTGPFLARTGELGVYIGVRDRGKLIAMAGERLQVPGWIEISAVCTDPNYPGRGLARMLMEKVGAGIRRRGSRPFLHVLAGTTGAIHLYEAMGFVKRRTLTINAYQPD